MNAFKMNFKKLKIIQFLLAILMKIYIKTFNHLIEEIHCFSFVRLNNMEEGQIFQMLKL